MAALAQWSDHPEFVAALEILASEPECADAATWCCKDILDKGCGPVNVAHLVACAAAAPGWAAKLHVLQMLPGWAGDISEDELVRLTGQAIGSDRVMLRAWGYAGADNLAVRFPDHAVRVGAILAIARNEETAGSIRARLKRCHH